MLQLNVRNFLNAYQGYCHAYRRPESVFGTDPEIRTDFEEVAFYPKGLDEISFLASYIGEPNNVLANLVNNVFNSIPLSHVYKTLVDGFDFLPNMHLRSCSSRTLEMSFSYGDDYILFSAVRTFSPHKNQVTHNSCGALSPKTQKPMHSGYGSRFLFNSLALYDQIDVKQIHIPEAVKAGIKAWPKMGFVFDQDYFETEVVEIVTDYIDRESDMPEERRDYLMDFLECGPEFAVRLYQDDPTLFSEIMAEIDAYSNAIQYAADLTDAQNRAFFDSYFSEKGIKKSSNLKQKPRSLG